MADSGRGGKGAVGVLVEALSMGWHGPELIVVEVALDEGTLNGRAIRRLRVGLVHIDGLVEGDGSGVATIHMWSYAAIILVHVGCFGSMWLIRVVASRWIHIIQAA